jgi:hypothetical protein
MHTRIPEPDTTLIRNSNGQPLPTDLDGRFAARYLIGKEEMNKRRQM